MEIYINLKKENLQSRDSWTESIKVSQLVRQINRQTDRWFSTWMFTQNMSNIFFFFHFSFEIHTFAKAVFLSCH